MTAQDTLAGRLRSSLNLEGEPSTRTNGHLDHRDGGFEGFEGAKSSPFSWADPKPIRGGLAPVDPFDISFMPAALGPWVEDISERLQCPPDYVGVTAIAGLGSLIGCRAGIKPQEKTDWMETPNLWAIFIGRPGMLKSPAMGEALGPLKHLEREAAKENEVAQLAYAAGLSHYKVRQQVKLSLEKDALKHSLLENQQAQRGREIKNAAPPQTLKTLKTGFEGFEGGQGCHVFRFEGGPEGNGVCTNEVARGPENQKLPPPRTVKTVKTRPPMDVSSLSCASVAPPTLN